MKKFIEIQIYLYKMGFTKAGILTINEDQGYSSFEYSDSYINQNLPPLNPSTLNWRINNQKVFTTTKNNKQMLDRTFWELLPCQNDWGNQVLISRYPEYTYMNNAQKLYFLGGNIVGGLRTIIENEPIEENINNLNYLDQIRDESLLFYQKQLETIKYAGAIKPLTSYGGMRPKCMYEEDGVFWIVKFNTPEDMYDMALTEQIAMEMARDVGLNTADSKVVQLPSGENAFFSKRFDREDDLRLHSLSLFSLVPGNESLKKPTDLPGSPSGFIQALIRRYSDFENMDTLNIVTKMLLDIGVNNTDNHLRNLRIILNKNNKWELSPMYDITFNPFSQNHVYNPAGLPLQELYLENPKLISSMSKELGVKEDIIETQLDKVKNVLYNWESYCTKYNLSYEDKLKVGNAISLGLTRQEYNMDLENKILLQDKKTISYPALKLHPR
jgi:serine/threonine-protein kinase HipA